MIGQDADMSAAPIRRQAARIRCQVRSCARSIPHRLPSLRPSPLPSTPSAAAPRGFVRALHRYYEARPTPRLFHGSFGSSPSCHGPGSLRATAGQTRSPRFRRVPFVRDGIFDHGRATAFAYRDRTCCLRRFLPARPLRFFCFRGSITHPTRSLCTLRDRRRRRPRNTRYRALATAYPRRSSTGRTTPACLAHGKSKSRGGLGRPPQGWFGARVLRLSSSLSPPVGRRGFFNRDGARIHDMRLRKRPAEEPLGGDRRAQACRSRRSTPHLHRMRRQPEIPKAASRPAAARNPATLCPGAFWTPAVRVCGED